MSKEAEAPSCVIGTIGDIAIVNPSVSLAALDRDALVSFVTMADVSESGKIVSRQVRPLCEVRSGFTRFIEGDTLFAKITPCMENGKGAMASNLMNGYGFGSTEFHVLRANEKGDSDFLYHLSMYDDVRTKALSFFSGSAGQQRVATEFFNHYQLVVPKVSEQRKIARILTTLDDLIEKTEALIAKYQAIKQGMMHDLFTRGVDEHGHLRPTYEEAPELYKETELGWIPKTWKCCPLHIVVPRAEYGISVSLDDSEGIPILRMNNLHDGKIDISDIKRSSSLEALRLRLHDRDVLFNRTNSIEHVGKTSIWRNDLPTASFASYLVRLLADQESLIPEFLVMWLNLPETQIAIRQFATPGVHQVNINPTNLRRTLISLPIDIKEQKAICRVVEQHEYEVEQEIHYLRKLHLEKSGLMQDLLTGKVRVKVDKEERVG